MAKNNLTPEQDYITRQFYANVAANPDLFPQDPVGQRNMIGVLLRLLNYTIVNGKFVEIGTVTSKTLGGTVEVTCEWDDDMRRAIDALDSTELEGAINEASNSTSTSEADSSVEAEDSEVRETLLREDV
jgi:hypothetical protein